MAQLFETYDRQLTVNKFVNDDYLVDSSIMKGVYLSGHLEDDLEYKKICDEIDQAFQEK